MTETATLLDPYRLPRTVVPRRYDVVLGPDLGAARFDGTVDIDIAASETCETIVLNAIELEIERCSVDGEAAEFRLDPETERLFVTPSTTVAAGDHVVSISFAGVLNDQLRGWYRSTYRDDDGNEHVIATSQMQATDCRRAFPCWDEPDFKAVFAITLVVEAGSIAVSNMAEIQRSTDESGREVVRFADSMVMSSYLVAFVVGPLEATEWVDVDGTPVRIVHVPGKGGLTQFGLDVAAFCLRWFQDYYGIPYPGDKVDLLALPDFAAGAMENLGCITFRENLLLVDPETSTQNERQLVVDVVAHELAHMWFGDLVTMRWWNGIWLNEAFATFMELAACDAFRPEWERWTAFGIERSVAFETDSLSSTRPVEYEVHSPADCEGMFDVLTYQKGGALLRMLEQHLGEERFRRGVSHYLDTHAYGNTETSDLWDAIERSSGEPVRRIMDSWIWQPGYPLVTARMSGDDVVLSQQQFSFAGDADPDSAWSIPLAVRHGGSTTTLLLEDGPAHVTVGDDPVVVNAGGHGFYRVAYDGDLRSRLTGDVVAELSTLERYNIVDDAWNAAIAGALDVVQYLDVIDRFADEREYGVWQSMASGLRAVRRLIDDEQRAVAGFEQHVAALAGPAFAAIGEPHPEESDLTRKLRGLLLTVLALQAGDHESRDRARRYVSQWGADPSSVGAEVAAAATSIVAATGDAADYDRMLDLALHSDTPQVQLRHLYALADFDDESLVDRTCDLAMSDRVKTQNAPFLLGACVANRRHGRRAWSFVQQHWDEANERFPSNSIVRMVGNVKLLDRPSDVAEATAFFADHPIPQASKTLEQLLERQVVNAAVRTRNETSIIRRFAD